MKSKICIDLDDDNQPIIKIRYENSEDVRDKMVKKFLETFGGDSCLATFIFQEYRSDHSISTSKIRPIKASEVKAVEKSVTTLLAEIYRPK